MTIQTPPPTPPDEDESRLLDESLEATFPASDPIELTPRRFRLAPGQD